MKINGGYYIKARKIQESKIQRKPPYVREIWDWLLMNANHSDNKYNGFTIKRGQLFRTYRDIREGLSWHVGYRKEMYSENQMKKAMKSLRDTLMIDTAKELGGVMITILNYSEYQDPKNYESTSESTSERTNGEPMENQGGTANNKNEKNEKNEKKEEIHTHVEISGSDDLSKSHPQGESEHGSGNPPSDQDSSPRDGSTKEDQPALFPGQGKKKKKKSKRGGNGNGGAPYAEIIGYLNKKTGRNFSPATEAYREKIEARWNEPQNYIIDDFRTVIDNKCAQWLEDPEKILFLRPETLFSKKFETYRNEIPIGLNGESTKAEAVAENMGNTLKDWKGKNEE